MSMVKLVLSMQKTLGSNPSMKTKAKTRLKKKMENLKGNPK
jgi:hypothetical protein